MKMLLKFALFMCLAPVAMAETVMIPVGEQAPELQGIDRPARFMTKEAVEAAYGEPLLKGDAVGEPLISRWEYSQYFVYFEHDQVLATVLKSE